MLRMLRRMVQIGACAAVLIAWLPPAYSAPKACVVAWRNADTLAKDGQLRAAKTQMLKCAHYTCGGALSKECSRRVVEIEADTPTIVPVVKNDSGEAITDLQLAMDGEVLATKIDGRAIMVDPGTHEFTFQTDKNVYGSYKAVILQGQRNRPIEVTLRAEDRRPLVKRRDMPGSLTAAAMRQERMRQEQEMSDRPEVNFVPDEGEEPQGRRFTSGTLGLAGVGVLGLAGYSLGNYTGNKENKALNDCSPNCSVDSVNRVQNFYNVAKISLGVGIAALAGATYLYLTSAPDEPQLALIPGGYRLDVQPSRGGGFAALSGSF
jgi:hypothetical protein